MKHLGFASIAAVQQYLRYARAQRLNVPRILKQTELPSHLERASGGRIQGEQFQTLIATLMEHAEDPLLGLNSSLFVQTESYTQLGLIALNCANLEQAIQRIPPFERLVGDMGSTQLKRSERAYELSWHCQYTQSNVVAQMNDNVLASWVLYARWLTGSNAAPIKVELCRARPPEDLVRRYEWFFRCPVNFTSKQNAIVLPNSVVHLPLTRRVQSQLALLEGKARSALAQVTVSDDNFSESVRRSIQAHLQQGVARKELIAQEFNLSERTLQRRLAREGTNYQSLLKACRFERAKQLLKNQHLSANDIALNLGFSDIRCFYRSFKEWSGQTPLAYSKAK